MDLVNRLKIFMENEGIAISQFADTCKIPRPTMSQILNGRNKKISDELISKIHIAYPHLSVLWLMFGEGAMTLHANIKTSEPQTTPETGQPNAHHPANQNNTNAIKREETSINNTPENSAPQTADIKTNIHTFRHTSSPIEYPYETAQHSPNPENAYIDFSTQAYTENHNTDQQKSQTSPIDNLVHHQDSINYNLQESQSYDEASFDAKQSYAPQQPPMQDTPLPTDQVKNVSIKTNPAKTITNIVVFYSDNSFQSFYPTI